LQDAVGAIDGVHIDAVVPTDEQIPYRGRKGKYYLVDSGFQNIPGFLAPFRGATRHFQEMRRRGGPRGRKELFNFRHSSLRNVIERCFGVLKARFPILKFMRSYSLRKQTSIVIACCALHNFIKIHAEDDKLFHEYENYEDEEGSTSGVELPLTEFNVSYAATREMTEKRDAIANQLWSDNHV
ncbi:unnamed protein product, partial [Linum tenue]